MDFSAHLNLPYLLPNQAQKHVTVNEALGRLDILVQMAVLSSDVAIQPAGPAEGDAYILPAAPTGDAWGLANAGDIAAFVDGGWMFLTPRPGWLAYDLAERALLVRGAEDWRVFSVSMLGVNTSADATNRLAVKSDAVLLSHDDVTPGSGDLRAVLNKAGAGGTASLVFQTGYSGRAEFGLAGDDDLHLRVSADGSSWADALRVDRASGRVSLPLTPGRDVLAAARTYFVRTDGNDANDGRADSAGGAFRTIQKAVDKVFGTLDLNGFDVTIQVGPGTYAEAVRAASPQVGAGAILLRGDPTTPANVTVSSGGETSLAVKGSGTRLRVSGIKVTNAGFAGWHAESGGYIESAGRNEMGAVGGHQIVAEGPSAIHMVHEMIMSGGCAGSHLNASNNGFIYLQGGSWTIIGTPAVDTFASAAAGGVIYTFANTFTGSLAGQRYAARLNGVIETNSGGNTAYFPGSAPGTTASGAQYS